MGVTALVGASADIVRLEWTRSFAVRRKKICAEAYIAGLRTATVMTHWRAVWFVSYGTAIELQLSRPLRLPATRCIASKRASRVIWRAQGPGVGLYFIGIFVR